MTLSTDTSVPAPQTVAAVARSRPWRDHKKPLWVLGLIVPVLPFVGWGLVTVTGSNLFWFAPTFVVFVIVGTVSLNAASIKTAAPPPTPTASPSPRPAPSALARSTCRTSTPRPMP